MNAVGASEAGRSSRWRRGRRWSAALAPAVVWGLALVIRIADPPLLEEARLRVFDAFLRMSPRPPLAESPVRVVDFDDETLQRLGQWPWPRTRMAALVDRLHALGAGPIAFDVVFAEPDRTSPLNVIPLWPSTPEVNALRAGALSLPDHDQILAEAVGHASVVTGFALVNMRLTQPIEPLAKAAFAFAGPDPGGEVIPLEGAVTNLRLIEEAAVGNGHLTILAERDGIARRVPLLLRLGERLYPSVVAEVLRVAQGVSTYVVKSVGASGEGRAGRHHGIVSVKIGRFVVPTDTRGVMWVYYARPVPQRTIPVWRVLAGEVSPEELRGRLVFIGTSAAGLKDLRATPLHPATPGVEVHAQLAEQILSGTYLQRPDWAGGAEVCYLALLGLALVILLPRAGAPACAWMGIGAVGLACGSSWLAFRRARLLLDPVMPSATALAIYLAGSFVNFLRVETERRRVRDAFSRYLSPVVAEQLARHPERLRLGGETRTITTLFADIRGFTALAERFTAEELAQFMNRFLTPMTGLIQERQGTIDKYIGDCIMAFWNAPIDDPDHARHAGDAALAMRRHLVDLNLGLRDEALRDGRPFRPVLIGIGINTGECTVGNFGSEQRFDYSAMGDPVNLASRLQGQAKTYGADIIVGPSTAEAIARHALLELDLVRVVGRVQPIRIYALLGDATLASDAGFQTLRARHAQLLAAYRARRWNEARECLDACLALDTRVTRLRILYHLYTQRLDAYRTQPPPADWDGVWVATSK